MKIYHFDEIGAFLYESEASIDPLETERAESTIYLLPSNCTSVSPPEIGQNQVALFSAGLWQTQPDFRGETLYRTSDKEALVVDSVGGIPSGYTNLQPSEFGEWSGSQWISNDEQELLSVKQVKQFEINQKADASLSGITAAYPESERLSWNKQELEARSWLNDQAAKTPLLSGISRSRGIELENLIEKVIIKSDAFAVRSGLVFGCRQMLEEMVETASTVGDVNSIEIVFE